MLTLALSSWSFHRRLPFHGDGSWSPKRQGDELSILDFPRLAASLGIHEIEMCQTHLESNEPSYLDRVRSAVADAGCTVVNVPIDVGELVNADPAARDAEIGKMTPWIDAAHYLGSPLARVNTGHPEGIEESEALKLAAEGYRRLAEYCGERGMSILLENHGGLSASPQNIMRLVELAGSPNFRLCPDFGNFAPEVREEGLRLMLPHAAIVHAKVYDVDENGRHPSFDLGRCVAIVQESGYSGSLSIEFEGKGDEETGVERGRDLLQSILGAAGRA